MKVLTATQSTQGQRKNDFFKAREGEIVGFVSECDGEAVDGKCGCKRCMVGVASGSVTTTMKVEERDVTIGELEKMMLDYLVSSGWITKERTVTGTQVDSDGVETPLPAVTLKGYLEEDLKWARNMALDVAEIARGFEVGMVIEKRGATYRERHGESEHAARDAHRQSFKNGEVILFHHPELKTDIIVTFEKRNPKMAVVIDENGKRYRVAYCFLSKIV